MSKNKNKKQNNGEENLKQENANLENIEMVIEEEEIVVVEPIENDDTNQETDITQEESSNGSNTGDNFGVPDLPTPGRKLVLILLCTVAVAGILYVGKQYVVAATVNGRPIFRYHVVKQLEKQGGEQTLENLVREELIKQEAAKRKIVVSQQDLDAEFNRIDASLKSQGSSLDAALKEQGITRSDVEQSIKIQLVASKLVKDKVKVEEDEIKSYMEQNKDFLPKDQSEAELKKTVEEYIRGQKESVEIEKMLNDLKGKAKIMTVVQY